MTTSNRLISVLSVFSLLRLFTAVAAQSTTTASSCTISVSTKVPAPSVASGFEARLVASGLTTPRGIMFDSAGHLLVVQSGVGVTALTLQDNGGSCVGVASQKAVVNDTTLNHGIALSFDNKTLYVSSPEAVYTYGYDPTTASTSTITGTIIVANMSGTDHTTRTLLLSRFQNGSLIVTRGSTANIDPQASVLGSGHSEIRSFNLLNLTAPTLYQYNTSGQLLGWGLRNDVGIAEHPITGGLYSVENSVDQMMRNNVDISENNPGEELNFLGTLINNNSTNQGSNFGYPQCFSAWNVSSIPDNSGLDVGQQFSIDSNANDTYCKQNVTAPRLVFQAHQAPLDIKFNSAGSEAWVTFHGSWDRTVPVGYKISSIAFNSSTGDPLAASDSLTAAIDIISNANTTACPSGCFRPVGLAWDAQGRLFFSSDSTGEIYVITAASSTAANTTASGGNSTSSGSGSVQTASPSPSTGVTSVAGSGTGVPTSSSTADTASKTGAANKSFGGGGMLHWGGREVGVAGLACMLAVGSALLFSW